MPAHHVRRAKDSHKFWYKPTISRDEAISVLRHAPPGTFVVRDSNSFPGAFGLALKVVTPPEAGTTDPDELVRHFLIEPTKKGVKLKASLSTLQISSAVFPNICSPIQVTTYQKIDTLGASIKDVPSKSGLFNPLPPCPPYDVIVTIKVALLCPLWADPPSP